MNWVGRLLTGVGGQRAATPDNPRFSLNDPGAWEAFLAGSPSSAGLTINRQTALTLPAFWRGIHLICNTIGKLPELIYKRVDGGKTRATEHAAYSLLRYQPIPDRVETTAFDQKRVKMGHVLLKGNGYRYIVRNGDGTPRELLLLDPDTTYPVRVNGRLWYVTKVGGEERKLQCEDVIHWKGLGWDGLCGYDVLTYAREAMGEAMAKQKFSASFFGKNAVPGVSIEFPAKITDQAKEGVVKRWNQMHQGIDNLFRVAVLDGGATIKKLSIDANDAQLIESREFSLIDVANILNLPPHKLGDKNSRGFASLEQEDQNFLDDCIDGWLCMIEAEDREKLLSEEEKAADSHQVEFLRQALVRGDLAARSNYYRVALGGRGWMTINEVRALENQNPDDGDDSDSILTPLNMGKGGQDNEPDDKGGPQPGNPANNSAAIAAVRICAEDAARRAIVLVGHGARRAAKDGGKYVDWVDGLQADQQSRVAEMLTPPVAAASALMSRKRDAALEAEWLLASIHKPLSEIADRCKPGELATVVDAFLIDAETNAPSAWARELLGEESDGEMARRPQQQPQIIVNVAPPAVNIAAPPPAEVKVNIELPARTNIIHAGRIEAIKRENGITKITEYEEPK